MRCVICLIQLSSHALDHQNERASALWHANDRFTLSRVSSGAAALQAYEFAFNPQAGLDALNSNLRPVSAGSLPVLPSSGGNTSSISFDLLMRGCYEASDPVFSTWPEIEPATGYFALFALASQHGVLNSAFEGAVASTSQL